MTAPKEYDAEVILVIARQFHNEILKFSDTDKMPGSSAGPWIARKVNESACSF